MKKIFGDFHSVRRLIGDFTGMWKVAPKRQAMRWYGLVLLNLPTILSTRKLYVADAKMGGTGRFKAFGQDFEFDMDAINSGVPDLLQGNAHAFLRELFVRGAYFRAFLAPSFETCLDLGCNMGIVSTVLRKLGGPSGRVIAVDPLEYPTNMFAENARSTQGVKFERAVACDSRTLSDPESLHALCDPYGFDVNIASTIPQILERNGISHVDFVKMDIEGAEFSIFADPIPWLGLIDNLAMEVHSEAGNPAVVIECLRTNGFDTTWSNDYGYPVDMQDAAYIYASRNGQLRN